MIRRAGTLALLLVALISGALPICVAQDEAWDLLLRVPPIIVLAPLSLFAMTWMLNALRVRIFFYNRAQGFTQCYAVATILSCDLAAKTTPGGSGVPFMAVAIMKQFEVNPGVALSGFVAISFIDAGLMLFFVAFLSVSGVIDQLVPSHQAGEIVLFAVLFTLLVSVFISTRLHNHGFNFFVTVVNRILMNKPMRYRIFRQLVWFRWGLRDFMRYPAGRRCSFLLTTLVFWSMQLSLLYAALIALNVQISWFDAAIIQIISMAAGRLLFLPGGVLATEGVAVALLSASINPSVAATAVLVWRSSTLFASLFAGGISSTYFVARMNRGAKKKK
ncbi:lysylphosphatidylglycerol synthase transmembrane domain-containing protein [Alcanivorax jadensis]|uniref:lysylphosphatidylglycerol synthase transmembrane domain-containing protein n=1 Tax=Alcanivorax jadensis TaxID=64988 RepID=UPI002409CB16|nr:lysylphosphatidylglycerol synthase transmembrane domain-containing protein [Alcanivorax jadensis]MDF1637854.1 lysylphosphatidylglycerol synthase transmembrane domain-containing protein [Alcanivorax jadensis]